MKLEDYLSGTKFETELAKAILQFMPTHMKHCLENPGTKYEEYGTEKEICLKSIVSYYSNIGSVLSDIDLTIEFLKKDRKKILEDYPFLESQGKYYKYHYENYYIRLLTVLDLIGKLGTLVYDLDIDIKKVSAYTFKDKARKEGFEESAILIEKLTSLMGEFKIERHKKLHSGEADIEPLNGIVIWEDINSLIGSDTSDILQYYTDQNIGEEIELLSKNTIAIIDTIKEFLELSTDKLKEKGEL